MLELNQKVNMYVNLLININFIDNIGIILLAFYSPAY